MPTKKRIQYRYTPTGQRSALIDPDGGRFTYSYDSVKRSAQVINPQGERTSYSYDAAGRRTVKKLANGSRTSFSYNAASRITSVAHLKSDTSVQARYEYQYDKAGNRTSMSETGATTARTTWSYDDAYQLTGEHRTGSNAYRNTYVYDNRRNRTLKDLDGVRTTSTYDDANQLKWSEAAGGRTTYVFDADGNQQVVLSPSRDRVTNLWDYENRQIGVQHPAGSRETMAYDPDGKRVKLEESASTTKYVWDDQNYLQETDASDVTQVTYTNEPRTYGNLISQRKSGASHYYLFDALGSTRLVTDASQNVAENLLYDAWGNLVGSAPTLAVPFRWVGELGYLFVPSSSDYYVRARVYQPGIGRWISKDPLGFVAGMGVFVYVSNSPTLTVDPSGLVQLICTWDVHGAFCRYREPTISGTIDCDSGFGTTCCTREKPKDTFWCSYTYREWRRVSEPTPRLEESFDCTRENFLRWYYREKQDMFWLHGLPNCPCELPCGKIYSAFRHDWYYPSPDSSIWEEPSEWTWGYHPGALACMRSVPQPGIDHGQQCCYNKNLKLIKGGEDAGTPDYVNPSDYFGHRLHDILPYNFALELNAQDPWVTENHPEFSMGAYYREVRPPNRGVGCD